MRTILSALIAGALLAPAAFADTPKKDDTSAKGSGDTAKKDTKDTSKSKTDTKKGGDKSGDTKKTDDKSKSK